jgi:predicted nucleotidyltransferase
VADPVETLSLRLKTAWPNIAEARRQTLLLRGKLAGLSEFSSEDASIIVFGSVGRAEVTEASDVDWTLLIDGPSDPNHAHLVVRIRDHLEALGLEKPGRTETFGVMAFSHDLIHHIAGNHDTNQNMTRRLLLLFESVAATEPLVRRKVLHNVLDRYVTYDIVAPMSRPPRHVIPHFLLNDVVRYWRTMASDYAAKMWERQNEGWGLRNIKLRFSRKLIFVAGLLACFSFELHPPPAADAIRSDRENLPAALANHVLSRLTMTPLDALAAALLAHSPDETSSAIFGAYDRFLGVLLDPEKRAELSRLRIDKALESRVWLEARSASYAFRDGLEKLFLKNDGLLSELTLRFGVF